MSNSNSTPNIYEQYGRLMIEQEILQARINVVKQAIASEFNKSSNQAKKEEKNAEI